MAYNKLTMDNRLDKINKQLKYANSLSIIMLNIEDAMKNFANIKNQQFEGTAKEQIMAYVENISQNYEKIKTNTEKIILATNKTIENLKPTLEELEKKIEEYNIHIDKYNALQTKKNVIIAANKEGDNNHVE